MRLFVLPLLTTLVLAPPGFAGDGVLEINQTCATQTGCFSGDTAGYPVTIDGSAGRSYVLTSDLIVPDENTDGIVVSTPDVGIDLNLFTIIRAGCVGATTDCTPLTGTGSGIEVPNITTVRGVAVRNGSITGMGRDGILLGPQAEIKNLRVRWNGLDGIFASGGSTVSGNTTYQNGRLGISAGSGSTVSGNTAHKNGNSGISANYGSTVSDNTAFLNGNSGINAGDGVTVSGNTAYLNGGDGIFANHGSTVSDNTASDNKGDGIQCNSGCTVLGNTAYSNGDATNPTLDDGIECNSGCTVRGNTVRNNSGYGLNVGVFSAYRENAISANNAGQVTGTGVDAGANVINGVVSPTP